MSDSRRRRRRSHGAPADSGALSAGFGRRYVPLTYRLTAALVTIDGTQIADILSNGLGVSPVLAERSFPGRLAVCPVLVCVSGTRLNARS